MRPITAARHGSGLTLRQAALIAAFAYLLMPVLYAELSIMPRLIVRGHIDQTIQNIVSHQRLFGVAILCYLTTGVADVVIAWALYVLLAPVNRAVSLLTAWFRLVYTAVALFALLRLVEVYRLVVTPEYLTLFGAGPLRAEAQFLLNSFRYEWSFSLAIFGIHLLLLGCLIARSGYIPRLLGILIALDGVGWMVSSLRPYLYPDLNFGFFFVISFVELLLPLWLLIRGWKIQDPLDA